MERQRKELLKEYEEKINRFHILWPLKILGFIPFYIENGKVVSKNITPKWCLLSFLIIWHLSVLYIYSYSTRSPLLVITTERLIILVITVLEDCMIINNLLLHRTYGEILCHNLIDIDIILGGADTKFMRDIPARQYLILSIIVGIVQAAWIPFYCMMEKSHWSIKIAVIIFFSFNLTCYNYSFTASIILFLSMRVRYLNVTLIKLAKLNPTYFPKYKIFDGLFWKNEYDGLVKFHNRATCLDFTETYKIIYLQLRILEKYCQLTVLMSIIGLIVVTFSTLQAFIEYLITPDHFKTIFTTIWVIGGWSFSVYSFIQLDFLYDEIERSKLICTYILLKDSIPLNIIQIADSIMKTLITRNYFGTIYGMFETNSGMFLRLAAALTVYITMQLQIALEGVKDIIIADNVTENNTILNSSAQVSS